MHELRITNQVIYLNPPIEECRYKLYQEMFAWKMVVLSLPRIQSQRYQVSAGSPLRAPPRRLPLCRGSRPSFQTPGLSSTLQGTASGSFV